MYGCGYCGGSVRQAIDGDSDYGWKTFEVHHSSRCSDHPGVVQRVDQLVRPSWDLIWMQFANSLADRSSCRRLQVGCVIVSADNTRVLSVGYNGSARGMQNDCQSSEPGNCGCLHAEENALIKLAYSPAGEYIRMYTTTSPCEMCAKRIANAGVKEVVYLDEYRNFEAGKRILETCGISVRALVPEDG